MNQIINYTNLGTIWICFRFVSEIQTVQNCNNSVACTRMLKTHFLIYLFHSYSRRKKKTFLC